MSTYKPRLYLVTGVDSYRFGIGVSEHPEENIHELKSIYKHVKVEVLKKFPCEDLIEDRYLREYKCKLIDLIISLIKSVSLGNVAQLWWNAYWFEATGKLDPFKKIINEHMNYVNIDILQEIGCPIPNNIDGCINTDLSINELNEKVNMIEIRENISKGPVGYMVDSCCKHQ